MVEDVSMKQFLIAKGNQPLHITQSRLIKNPLETK